jgi:hypothetical protein
MVLIKYFAWTLSFEPRFAIENEIGLETILTSHTSLMNFQ